MTLTKKCVPFLRQVIAARSCSYQQRATIYSKYRGVPSEWITWVQQDIDLRPSAIHRYVKKLKWKQIKQDQAYDLHLRATKGVELGVAHFIVSRGGAIKFLDSEAWIRKKGKLNPLPTTKKLGYKLEAIDASGLNIIYDSFDNFEDLRYLKYLRLAGCKYVDDWCFERLPMFANTLRVLDVSGCPNVTEKGLATLHKLPNLSRLICNDMPAVKHPSLTRLLVEEMLPSCVIEGLPDYTDPEVIKNTEPVPEPYLIAPPVQVAKLIMSKEFVNMDILDNLDDEDEKDSKKTKEVKLLRAGEKTVAAET